MSIANTQSSFPPTVGAVNPPAGTAPAPAPYLPQPIAPNGVAPADEATSMPFIHQPVQIASRINPATGIQEFSPEDELAITRLMQLIDRHGDMGSSDVHIHPNKAVRYEHRKSLKRDTSSLVSYFKDAEIEAWLAYASKGRLERFYISRQLSTSVSTSRFRARITFHNAASGLGVALRLIPSQVPNASALGLPKVVMDLVLHDSGLVMVCGPTGSGKSTMLASLLDLITATQNKHIMTLEDPIEFLHEESGSTIFTQREIGVHVASYAMGIEDALRSKPHVILIGEILDSATANAALLMATTGHLVFTTSHAGSTKEAISGLIGRFPADEQDQAAKLLAESLLAVVVQRLLPGRAEPGKDSPVKAVRELMMNNSGVEAAIEKRDYKKIWQQIDSTMNKGSFTFETQLAAAVKNNEIELAVAMESAKEPDKLLELLQKEGLIPNAN
jgi:twitching motility protein PilT